MNGGVGPALVALRQMVRIIGLALVRRLVELDAGCTTHIVKPVDFAALGKLMSDAAALRTA